MKRTRHSLSQAVATAAALLLTAACTSPVSLPCEDHAKVDIVFHDADTPVVDTVTARFVFEEYVEHVRASGESFPDGAEDWLLDQVSPSAWEVAPWVVSYFPQPGDPFTRQVYIDRTGRIVKLVIAVHPPC